MSDQPGPEVKERVSQPSLPLKDEIATSGLAAPLRVVYLRNFLSPDALAICQAWSRRMPSLTVLVSVAMEANRQWNVNATGVDIQLQRTWTICRKVKHPDGYRDVNYVHLPRDTLGRLRRLSPDVIVSTELGMRSIMAAIYCRWAGWWSRRRCHLVLSVSTTPWIERSRRGRLRRTQRRWLLSRAERVTYHGPECRHWLRSMGVPDSKLAAVDYSADPRNIYRGPIVESALNESTESRETMKPPGIARKPAGIARKPPGIASDEPAAFGRESDDGEDGAGAASRLEKTSPPNAVGNLSLLTVGQLIDRKGYREALRDLSLVASRRPEWTIRWTILGDGPLMPLLRNAEVPVNLRLDLRGHVGHQNIRDAYRDHEVLWFPTRGDEWGLVVDEALHSGLIVIGNPLAQASVTLIVDGANGFLTEVDDAESLERALSHWMRLSTSERAEKRRSARHSVRHRTPERSADQICEVIASLIGCEHLGRSEIKTDG